MPQPTFSLLSSTVGDTTIQDRNALTADWIAELGLFVKVEDDAVFPLKCDIGDV